MGGGAERGGLWVLAGALFGAVTAAVVYTLADGKRDFTSVAGMRAGRYEVMADEDVADEAQRRREAGVSHTPGRPSGWSGWSGWSGR